MHSSSRKRGERRRSAVVRDLDREVGAFVKAVFGGRCCQCGRVGGKLDWHHWARKRTHLATRWHPLNGVSLCYHCHCEQDTADGQQRLLAALDRWVGVNGWSAETLEHLRSLAMAPAHISTADLVTGLSAARVVYPALVREGEEALHRLWRDRSPLPDLPWWLGGAA